MTIAARCFRKTTIPSVHQKCPQMKAYFADPTCHMQEIANWYYRLVDRVQSSVDEAVELNELMTTEGTDGDSSVLVR
jgi:hypothetical protein